MSKFEHTLIDLNNDGDIVEVGCKTIYNLDGQVDIGSWCKTSIKSTNKIQFPIFSTALEIKETIHVNDLIPSDCFGCMSTRPSVMSNQQNIIISSGIPSIGGGFPLMTDNFIKACSAFAARRLIKGDWINDKDEYMKPSTDDPRYPEFEADSLVFCLFDSNSQQSSLRKVEYKDRTWDVKNEFFWIPSKKMAEWADAEGLDETYAEANVSPDRHMAKVLNGTSLSEEAKAVLDKATELVQKSMKFRQMFNDDHPEYQVLNFDCGWYQVKAILKEYMPNELKEFREICKKLADKMRPMVYELGFLDR